MMRKEVGDGDGGIGSSGRKLLPGKEKEAGAALSEDQPLLVYMVHARPAGWYFFPEPQEILETLGKERCLCLVLALAFTLLSSLRRY